MKENGHWDLTNDWISLHYLGSSLDADGQFTGCWPTMTQNDTKRPLDLTNDWISLQYLGSSLDVGPQ